MTLLQQSLAVVGDELNLDVCSASREIFDSDAGSSGLWLWHHLLPYLEESDQLGQPLARNS